MSLAGDVLAAPESIALGESALLRASLRNDGLYDLTLTTVQVLLQGADGESLVAEAQGLWTIGGQSSVEVVIPVRPTPGRWRVSHMIYRTSGDTGQTARLEASGWLEVAASPLSLVSIDMASVILSVGDVIALDVQVENVGLEPFSFDELYVVGDQPNGLTWRAMVDGDDPVAPASLARTAREQSRAAERRELEPSTAWLCASVA